jgi:hypothetical protein
MVPIASLMKHNISRELTGLRPNGVFACDDGLQILNECGQPL